MAIAALNSAATGLRALSTGIDVIANNLSNAETGAFKGSRVNFEDLMYLQLRQPGMTDSAGNMVPSGTYVGLGTKISNTQLDMTQGSLQNTDSNLDVGIEGPGFFPIKILDSLGGTGYTRNGTFFVNKNGDLVVGIGNGYELIPPINVGTNAAQVSIDTDGTVEVVQPNTNTKKAVGQIQLAQFVNPQGLNLLGGSIYTPTDASGAAINSAPGIDGAGTLQDGYLEASNVDPVKELVTLIETQRAFELNSQSIQTADQALQTIGNLRRS
jgi:flagellar basal-body rod protein FlgG